MCQVRRELWEALPSDAVAEQSSPGHHESANSRRALLVGVQNYMKTDVARQAPQERWRATEAFEGAWLALPTVGNAQLAAEAVEEASAPLAAQLVLQLLLLQVLP
mmetsp:Transcript_377/g.684  ORF Transcript_377/g.684 Transcript_377/m.684 type:complete len:105 (+) Transcript_377:650-964(+)